MRHRDTRFRCSFCGKSQEQVRRLIAGPGGVYICNECVALCNDIVAQDERATHPGKCTPWYRRAASWWRHLLRGRRHLGKALP